MRRMQDETPRTRYARYRRAIEGEPLPLALVDLDAFDENVGRILETVRRAGKSLRPATKSIRVPALLRRLLDRGAPARGLMTYAARETAWLAEQGFDDLLLAYPTAQPSDADALAAATARGATIRVVCDEPAHLEALDAAAARANVVIRVLAELDLAFRPLGSRLHLGVRRSPLRTAEDVVAFADRAASMRNLRFAGVMGYEAHVAGVADRDPSRPFTSGAKRAMKIAARRALERTRADVARALRARGHGIDVFNGGGTGSVAWTSLEPDVTEVTAGSGFLDSHLFDHYRDVPLVPAVFFALQVVRRPTRGVVTCAGGGYVASGPAGPDRLPVPALPAGAKLLPLEGAGEVQTPLALADGVELVPGDPVFFRHAKAGELAEHFGEYVLVRGDRIVERAPTYRGFGRCVLG